MAQQKGLYNVSDAAKFIVREAAEKFGASQEDVLGASRSRVGQYFFSYARCVAASNVVKGDNSACTAVRADYLKALETALKSK